MTEWCEWSTDPAELVLFDGRRVDVALGDMLLAEFRADGAVSFHIIKKRTVH